MKGFKNSKGEVVSLEEIVSLIERDCEYEVYVGTDSQVHRKIRKVIYATCIILYKKGKGGKIFVSRERENYAYSLRDRLTKETWRSLEISFALSEILPKNAELVVHVDVNKKKRYKSSRYCEELTGMVTGQGFECRVKPYAWAAQAVADKFSK